MADINLTGTLPPEILQQQQQLNRQQQMAQLLMQQGMQQPQGQMVSGRYVAPSIFQNLAPLLKTYLGSRMAEKGDKQALDLAKQLRDQQQQMGQNYFEAISPTQTELAGPTPTGAPLTTVNQPDYRKAFGIATDPYAPSWLKAQAAEMLKPQKVGEGEKVIRFNPATGKNEVVAEGGEKYRAPTSVDMGTMGTMLIYPDGRRETIQKGREGPAGQVVETANGPMIVNTRTGDATPIMAGGQPIAPKLTTEQVKDITAVNQQRATIDGAIADVQKNKSAFSFGRGVAQNLPYGESIAGRFEKPEDTQARAYVFNNVSAVIKERAGTAQSAQELTRLNSFLPATTDNADQIISKLNGFKQYLNDFEKGTRISPSSKPDTPKSNSFASEADAQKAFSDGKLKAGDKITINGVTGTWK
jgi:hypothetical protein